MNGTFRGNQENQVIDQARHLGIAGIDGKTGGKLILLAMEETA